MLSYLVAPLVRAGACSLTGGSRSWQCLDGARNSRHAELGPNFSSSAMPPWRSVVRSQPDTKPVQGYRQADGERRRREWGPLPTAMTNLTSTAQPDERRLNCLSCRRPALREQAQAQPARAGVLSAVDLPFLPLVPCGQDALNTSSRCHSRSSRCGRSIRCSGSAMSCPAWA